MPSWELIAKDPYLWKGLIFGFIAGLVSAKPLWIKFKQYVKRLDEQINCSNEATS